MAFVQSGEEAALLLRGHSTEYKALIVDIHLRGRMVGWDLAKLARQLNPEIPIVYTRPRPRVSLKWRPVQPACAKTLRARAVGDRRVSVA